MKNMSRLPKLSRFRHGSVTRRVLGWWALLISLGLGSIAVVAEATLRLSRPFNVTHAPTVFVPGVGMMLRPNTEIRHTNGIDYWTTSRTNRAGFLDRALPAGPAGQGCHICVIGDSFIEAKEVSVAQKVHVLLEESARRELPKLGVTTTAFGRGATAQASQLAIYDKYARQLAPDLLVLFFSHNDIHGNSVLTGALTGAWREDWDPERPPFAFPERLDDGEVRLRPPSPQDYRLKAESRLCQASQWLRRTSYFVSWMTKQRIKRHCQQQAVGYWRERLSQHPRYRPWLSPTLLTKEEFELTAFALRSFAERARRDGTALLVLLQDSKSSMDGRRVQRIAEPLGVPVLSLHDYVVERGGRPRQLSWPADQHWNELGHRQAAAALLDYLRENNENLCRKTT